MNELEGTASHEAAHAVALRHFNVRVVKVEVTTEDSGVTIPEQKSFATLTMEQVALVAFVGIYAESQVRPDYSVQEAISMLLGATSDRNMIYKLYTGWWLGLGDIGRHGFHNKAMKFVQDHRAKIGRVSDALLAKGNLPMVLSPDELDDAISG